MRYDDEHGTAMAASRAAYLRHFGDVWAAAEHLRVHANTLRVPRGPPARLTLAADSTKPRT